MAAAKIAATSLRIFFVEDDPPEFESFRHVAVDLLALDVEVVRVNAEDAFSIITASAATGFYPHLIVLNDHLQGRDRLKCLKELRRDLPQVPIVLLTQVRTDAATRREADKYDVVECFYNAASFDDFVVAVWQMCSYGRRECVKRHGQTSFLK